MSTNDAIILMLVVVLSIIVAIFIVILSEIQKAERRKLNPYTVNNDDEN